MSLSDYIKRDLERAAARPSFDEIEARLARGPRSTFTVEDTVAAIREIRDH